MFDVFEKRRMRRFFFSRVLTIVLFVVCIFLAHAAWAAYQKASFAQEHKDEAQAEQQKLQARADILHDDIAELSTDRGLESALRSRFDVGREGEQLVVLVDPVSAPVALPPEPTLLQRMRGWFGW